jgi:hypothetical protein
VSSASVAAHAPLPTNDAARSFEERVMRQARSFDLRPLVELLLSHGYRHEELLFESAHERSSGGVIDAVQFLEKPIRTVRITVNVGLLGDSTLLPSYFFQVVERGPDPERFYDFIRFFDHKLIERYFYAAYPELDKGVYRDFHGVERSLTRMLGMASVSTLTWLMKLFFPELRVRVERRGFTNTTASHALRTGESRLDGSAVLGRVFESEAAGFVVDLVSEDETDSRGRGWPHIVRARLERDLMPILAPHRVSLVLRLRVLFHASWVRMGRSESSGRADGYLGFERLRGDAEEGHTIVIYRGVTGENAAAERSAAEGRR